MPISTYSFYKQWVWGVPAVAAITAGIASHYKKTPDMITSGSPIIDGLIAGFAAYLITWVVGFIIRFIKTPALLYGQKADKVIELEEKIKPKIALIFENVTGFVVSSHPALKVSRKIKVANTGGEYLEDCQLRLGVTAVNDSESKVTAPFAISDKFSLYTSSTPQEIIFAYHNSDESTSCLYVLEYELDPNGKWYPKMNPVRQFIKGDYEIIIEAVSKNSMPAQKRIKCFFENDHWKFEECHAVSTSA